MHYFFLIFLLLISQIEGDDFHLFKVSGFALTTESSDFSTPEGEGQTIAYTAFESEVRAILPLSKDCGVAFVIGWEHENFDWDESPIFNQTHYNTLDLSFSGFLNHFENWQWILGIGTEVDTSKFNFDLYARYKGMLYGQYACTETLNFHIGLVALAGMKKETVLPILGLDYSPHCRWKLNFIFPRDVSVSYLLGSNWSLAVSARRLSSRHRTATDAPAPRALFEYTNTGGEASINYHPSSCFNCKLMAGSMFSGNIKIMDVKGRNSTYFEFDSALYLGGKVDIEF